MSLSDQERQMVASRIEAEIDLCLEEFVDCLDVTESALMQSMLSVMCHAPSDKHGILLITHCLNQICSLSLKNPEECVDG
jgi:hypothetical protein